MKNYQKSMLSNQHSTKKVTLKSTFSWLWSNCLFQIILHFWTQYVIKSVLTHLQMKIYIPVVMKCLRKIVWSPIFDYFEYYKSQLAVIHPVCAKSLKSQSFHPESHCLGQTCLIIAKILKINAYLGVAHLLQSYCTAVCSETSWQNGLCLKITLPKLQITWSFNIFH